MGYLPECSIAGSLEASDFEPAVAAWRFINFVCRIRITAIELAALS